MSSVLSSDIADTIDKTNQLLEDITKSIRKDIEDNNRQNLEVYQSEILKLLNLLGTSQERSENRRIE